MSLDWVYPQDVVISARACPDDGLAVAVSRTILGTYRVTFRDTDADQTIETRVFSSAVAATEYSWTLIPHVNGA
jgi:hypothetical protein